MLIWSVLFTTMGALLAHVLSVDTFLIGHLVGEKASAVAVYRVALLILMATSPAHFCGGTDLSRTHNYDNPKALRNYIEAIEDVWTAVAGGPSVLWCLSPWLLTVFGASTRKAPRSCACSFWALWAPIGCGSFAVDCFRRGRATNTYVNGVVLAMTIPLCWWAIPVWGIVGAAGVMATMLWVSGGLYVMVFELHLRRQSQV